QQQLDRYYGVRDLRTAFCHAGDPICEFSPLEGLFKLATGNYGDHMDYYSNAYPGEAEEDALAIAKLAHQQWLLALAAQASNSSVSWGEAAAAVDGVRLRTPSLSFAGTPTLVSAFRPDQFGSGIVYEFDLDGDGI